MSKQLNFNKEELISLYQLVREYCNQLPEDMDDWYHSHSDFDKGPIEKKYFLQYLKK